MRISDWSSDVCSSDLALRLGHLDELLLHHHGIARGRGLVALLLLDAAGVGAEAGGLDVPRPGRRRLQRRSGLALDHAAKLLRLQEIGRASCRERVCQYV